MQDEIVTRLAGALKTELAAAEARRAELSPNPDSVDLYFQGMAWLNKGIAPRNLTQARGFFDRALSANPVNVDALVGSGCAEAIAGAAFIRTQPFRGFRFGRSEADQGPVAGP